MVIAGFDFGIFCDFLHVKMTLFFFLPEKVTVTINPVVEWNRKDFDPAVFKNFNRFFAFKLMIYKFKTFVCFGNSEDGFQHFLYAFWAINMQWCFPSKKPERGDKSGQPKTVVAMKVRNKNMVDLRKSRFRFAELNLRTFTTIN